MKDRALERKTITFKHWVATPIVISPKLSQVRKSVQKYKHMRHVLLDGGVDIVSPLHIASSIGK